MLSDNCLQSIISLFFYLLVCLTTLCIPDALLLQTVEGLADANSEGM